MIGREHDLARVLDVLDRARACALVGPGGVGKTTLLSAAVAEFGERVVRVDAGSALRAEGVWATLLETVDADLDEVRHAANPFEICEVLGRRLSAASVRLLAIDHLEQHADVVIGPLARLLERSDVNVLIASRRHPRAPFGEVVRVEPLGTASPASPASLLFGETFVRAGGEPAELTTMTCDVEQLIEVTGGIPLAIVVAASQAATIGCGGVLQSLDARHQADDADPVTKTLESSFDDLDDDCLSVFEAVGWFRSDPSLAELAQLCAAAPADVAADVERLARRCLLSVAAGRISMLPPLRRLAHRFAVRHGRDHVLRERHAAWAYGVSRADPPLATHSVVAIEDDLSTAVSSALSDGRLDEAAAIATTLDDSFRADLRHRRRLDVLEPLLDACREASDDAGATDDVVDRTIEVLRLAAMARGDVFGGSAACTLLEEAQALLSRSGVAEQHQARLDALRAGFAFESGDLAAARTHATASLELAGRSCDDRARFAAAKMLADVELESGFVVRSIELANEVVRNAPASLRWLRAYALATVGACELERGALAVTKAVAASLQHEADELGDLDLVVEADWLMAMADPSHAPSYSIAFDDERSGRSTIHLQGQIAQCLRRLAAGDAASAISLAADCELRADSTPMRSLAIDARLLVGSGALGLGEIAEARRAFTSVLREASALGYRLRVPDALDGLADIAGQSIDGRNEHDRLRATAHLIRSQLDVVARPTPWRVLARTVPATAPDGWVDDGTLTADGIAGVLQPDADHEATGSQSPLDILSPAERVVAGLVAQGCTNREIGERLYVSRRTVESHISHAFQKLGLSSRTQLAALMISAR